MYNYIEKALPESDELLTVMEFIEVTKFPIDAFMIDRFWNTMEKDQLIYVDDELIRWVGYECDISDSRQNFKRMLRTCGEYFEYSNNEYSKFRECAIPHKEIYPPVSKQIGKGRTRHLLLTSKCLKMTMMKLSTSKGNYIREYYFAIESLFKEYVKYQHVLKNRQIEEKLAEKDIYINNIKSIIENVKPLVPREYVYIATTHLYASRNQFKIGKTGNLSAQLSTYNSGRPEGDRYFYTYYYATPNSVLLEKRITTPLIQWRDAKDREMFVINYDWLYIFMKQACEHDHIETGMINDLINDYLAIVSRKPPKVIPLLTYPKEKLITPMRIEQDQKFTFNVKGLTVEETKEFIKDTLKEYKKNNKTTSWTRLHKYLTIRLKEHDSKPNVKIAKDQIIVLCGTVGIGII